MTLNQTEYYQKHNIHPCRVSLEDEDTLARYFAIRKNLYQDLLHIPIGMLAGQDVLDMGCGTGESASILAMNGANLAMVDPDPTSVEQMKKLFSTLGIEDRIAEISISDIDHFRTKRQFSLVIAEGFIHTLSSRDEMMRKICRAIKPGGLGVISYSDRFGSFFEFIKKAVMWRAYQLAEIDDLHGKDAFDMAERLLNPAFSKLDSLRSFKGWWEDALLGPLLTWEHFWSSHDILSLIADEGCGYYSSSPRVFELPPMTWHKQVESHKSRQSAVLSSCQSRKFDMMFGQEVNITEDSPDFPILSTNIEKILKRLSAYFTDLGQLPPSIAFPKTAEILRGNGAPPQVVDELVAFFEKLGTNSLEDIIESYLGLETLANTWGRSYHYLCFEKNFGAS